MVPIEDVANRFELGRPTASPVVVAGGLSNELCRLVTDRGEFAVKRMVINAEHPDFVRNVEAAFEVEWRAWSAGVAMPEPVPEPATGRALASVDGSLFRVHRWVDGEVGIGSASQATALLAAIHRAGPVRWADVADATWAAAGWGPELLALTRRVGPESGRVLIVDSHRDLDRKNTLYGRDGVLMAVDWDAAGPASAVHEAVAVALDWAEGDPEVFAAAVRNYARLSGIAVPAQPWVFAGWVAAQGGWLDYNARYRADTPLGAAEVANTCSRLGRLAREIDLLLDRLR